MQRSSIAIALSIAFVVGVFVLHVLNRHESPDQIEKRAYAAYNRGAFAEGAAIAEGCVKCEEAGSAAPTLLRCFATQARILNALGEYRRAEAVVRHALEREGSFGAAAVERALLHLQLAETLEQVDRLPEAEEAALRAQDLLRKGGASDTREHASTLLMVGRIRRRTHRYAEAEVPLRECLAAFRKLTGARGPNVAACANDLCLALEKLGNLVEAEELARLALDIYEREQEGGHPFAGIVGAHLGGILVSEGRAGEAIPVLDKAAARLEREMPSTPFFAAALCGRGNAARASGDSVAAERYLRRCVETYERVLGTTHPSTLHALNDLGLLLWERGRYEEALPVVRRSLPPPDAGPGTDPADLPVTLHFLALVEAKLGNVDAADAHFREALSLFSSRALGTTANAAETRAAYEKFLGRKR